MHGFEDVYRYTHIYYTDQKYLCQSHHGVVFVTKLVGENENW